MVGNMSRLVQRLVKTCRNFQASGLQLNNLYTVENLAKTYSHMADARPAIKNASMFREALKSRFSTAEEAFLAIKDAAVQAKEKEVLADIEERMSLAKEEVDNLKIQEKILLKKLDTLQKELNEKQQTYGDLNDMRFVVKERAIRRELEREAPEPGWGRG